MLGCTYAVSFLFHQKIFFQKGIFSLLATVMGVLSWEKTDVIGNKYKHPIRENDNIVFLFIIKFRTII